MDRPFGGLKPQNEIIVVQKTAITVRRVSLGKFLQREMKGPAPIIAQTYNLQYGNITIHKFTNSVCKYLYNTPELAVLSHSS